MILTKATLGFVCLVLLIFLIIWLWQRQPLAPKEAEFSQKSTESQNQKQNDKSTSSLDNLVSNSQKIAIKGKTDPKSYLVIASNSLFLVSKPTGTGEFDLEITLEKGLNLINYSQINSDLKTHQQKSLTYFFDPKDQSKTVFAGTVKSIFDALITLTSPNNEVNIRTSRDTQFDVPASKDEEATESALNNIRVGDFAITLGDISDKDTQIAKKITIIRDNKPQNSAQILTAQIITSPKQNNFSVKNLEDSEILELTVNKETEIQTEGNDSQESPTPKSSPISQIAKDKNAIIIYHQEGSKNIVDLIYLLP